MRWSFGTTDRQLWRIALPMLLSNLSIPLLGLVDTAVVGHLASPHYLAGVALGTTATNFVFMLLLFLRMATTGRTAQAKGAGDQGAILKALAQPLALALLTGGLLALFSPWLIPLMLRMSGAEAPVQVQAHIYLHWRWWAAPAALANLAINGWLLGLERLKGPVLLLVLGNLCNIVLDLYLVVGLGHQVAGVAQATLLADYLTLAAGLLLVHRELSRRSARLRDLLPQVRGDLAPLLRLNRDLLIRSLLLQGCFASLTVLGARLGSNYLAANALLLNLLTLSAFALDALAYGVEIKCGQALGARRLDRLQAYWQAACRQGALVALGLGLSYLLWGDEILALLTNQPALLSLAQTYLPWHWCLPLVGVWSYLWDGLFVAATDGRAMRDSLLLASLGFALALLTLPWLGNHALWLAMSLFLALRAVTLAWIWRHRHNAGRALLPDPAPSRAS